MRIAFVCRRMFGGERSGLLCVSTYGFRPLASYAGFALFNQISRCML